MQRKLTPGWTFYRADSQDGFIWNEDGKNIGKWMIFFGQSKEELERINDLSAIAVNDGAVYETKVSSELAVNLKKSGVACFFVEINDNKTHKKIIEYLLKNNMINKTKKGTLYNLGFKLNTQTKRKEYGSNFTSKLTLDNFIDLKTGEWILK